MFSLSDLCSVCLDTIDHLNLRLWIFSGHTAGFGFSKVQDFGNFKLSPMWEERSGSLLAY